MTSPELSETAFQMPVRFGKWSSDPITFSGTSGVSVFGFFVVGNIN